jgi:PIN domain nuclease of toxin-antitoxin system
VILIDTHVALWYSQDDPKLPPRLRDALDTAGDNAPRLSVASVWEMAVKKSLGKLVMRIDLDTLVARFEQNGIVVVPVLPRHALRVETLPWVHRDPFDRLLAATCLVEGWSLASVDAVFDAYGVARV